MKRHWHEQIQRYVAGSSTEEETVALQQALNDDGELRALYLDYLNLDVALGAASEAAMMTGNVTGRISTFPGLYEPVPPHHRRWLAAAAACAALLMLVVFSMHRGSSRAVPDFASTISSTQDAIAQLSLEQASSIPAWISPTDSMLEPPEISK